MMVPETEEVVEKDFVMEKDQTSVNVVDAAARGGVLNVRGRDIGSFVDEVRDLFATNAIDLPSGYRVEYGGQFENLERGSRRLMFPLCFPVDFSRLLRQLASMNQEGLPCGAPLVEPCPQDAQRHGRALAESAAPDPHPAG